jgi:hypothetical protein
VSGSIVAGSIVAVGTGYESSYQRQLERRTSGKSGNDYHRRFYHEPAVINEHEPHSLSKLKTHYSYEKIYIEVIVVDKI